jgi:hypothetical protein
VAGASALLVAAPSASAVCTLPAERVAPQRQSTSPERAPLVIGDSTMMYALPHLARLGLEADARSCRGFPEAVALIRQRLAAHRLPPIVALGLGAGWPYFSQDVERVLRLIGPSRRLALITHRKNGGAPSEDTASLRRAAQRHPDRVILIDWVLRSEGRPRGWFYSDGLHVTPAGGLQYARFIARELRAVLRRDALRRRCFPPGADALAEGLESRIYRLPDRGVHACLFSTGHSRRLDDASTPVAGRVAIAGPYAAYASTLAGADQPGTAVLVADLRSAAAPAVVVIGPAAEVPAVTDLVLSRDGAVAWIAERLQDGQTIRQVARRRPGAALEVLGTGARTAAGSLRLRDGRLSWWDGPVQLRARL